nr:aminopeptidase m1 [Quercus suber]
MEQFKGQPRLPKFVVPKRYDIRLKLDLSACKFSGSVAIELNIVADTRFIVLNAAELSIDTTFVSFTHSSNSKVLRPSKVDVVEEDEILVLEFVDTLPIGMGLLTIRFQGTLSDKIKGFYTSTYNHNGENKNMAVTQFAPIDARRCFPCWDELACKAMFKITLDVPSKLVALSSMPIIEEKVDGDLKTVSYQESLIMSTYLVAIVVGLFDYVEHLTSYGVKVRVYCQVGKVNQVKVALGVAVRTLELYKDYFEVPYSLPKLDMVAIPDFAFGAMENYGLVTFCEMALLYDDQHSNTANKQRVVIAIAHELAHQWFGNLVTMEWQTHLWLNEGFATWVNYLAADNLFP